MTDEKKFGDKEIAELGAAAVIFLGLVYYWLTEVISTMDLLELAYGSLKFFNNPLDFQDGSSDSDPEISPQNI
jgi:hypothetical protein